MFSLAAHDRLRTGLAAAGFGEVTVEEMVVTWFNESSEASWAYTTEIAGAIAALIRELPDEVATVKDAIVEAESSYRNEDGSVSFRGVTIDVVVS